MAKPLVRRQDPYVALTKEQFRERFFAKFYDPVFEEVAALHALSSMTAKPSCQRLPICLLRTLAHGKRCRRIAT